MAGLILTAKAQNNTPLKDYTIKVWSNTDGLPSNNLSQVTQDQRGYIWISSFDGAARFDGNVFKIFETQNTPLLITSAIHSVLSLPDSSMYFSTQSSGLLYYKKGVFTNPFENSILPKNIIFSYMDVKGRLWIASEFEGLYFVEKGQVNKYNIPEFNKLTIRSIAVDADNAVWVASQGGGVAKITESGYELYTSDNYALPSNFAYSILYHKGIMYIGTELGLCTIKEGKWVVDVRFTKKIIYDIVADSNSNIWFATVSGLARLSNLDSLEHISVEDGLPERSINGIALDNQNNIWLATYRGGLVQLKQSVFKNISERDGLSYHNVNSISEAKDGRIFIGNYNGGIDVVENDVVKPFSIKTNLTNIPIKDILIEDDGTIWIANYSSLIKKTYKEEKVYSSANGLISNQMRSLLKASDSSIWVSSRNGGINIINKDGSIESISIKEGLGSDFIFSIDESEDGNMVLGSANGGVNIIDTNHNVEIIYPDTSLTGVYIFNIYIENESRMWLATNVGLYCYYNKEFYLVSHEKGLPVQAVFDVIEDKNENLWLTSTSGVIKIEKKELLKYVNGDIASIKYTLLDDSDGMISKECTGATRSLLASDGRIWFPTIHGVSILDPNNLMLTHREKYSPFIQNVIIDDYPVDKYSGGNLVSKIEIEPGHDNYIFDFTSLGSFSADKVLFKYKLEGFDKDWSLPSSNRQAKYTHLPYGTYTFEVKAGSNNEEWSDNYAQITIIIKPYFYETRSFIVFTVLFLIAVIILVFRLRTFAVNKRNKELIKLNYELDSFAYRVSHDLKAPLSSIQGLLNVARLDDSENAKMYYNMIEGSVHKLDNFIKDIIDYSKNARTDIKTEVVNVNSLVAQVIESLSHDTYSDKITSYVEIGEELTVTIDKTRLVFILNNLITNTFKYADLNKKEPFVKVKVYLEKDDLILKIIDNGQGIDKEFQSKVFDMFYRANKESSGSGLGLYIVKESVEKLKGNLELISNLGQGTTVIVTLPV